MVELVGSVPTETELSGLIGAQPHTGTPTEPLFVARHAIDVHFPRGASHALKLFGYSRSLEAALCRQGDVLKVTAAAASRTGVRTWWLHPIRRGTQNVGGIGADERGCRGCDLRRYPLAGQGMPHEHHAPIGSVRDAAATAGDVANFEMQEFPQLDAFPFAVVLLAHARHGRTLCEKTQGTVSVLIPTLQTLGGEPVATARLAYPDSEIRTHRERAH